MCEQPSGAAQLASYVFTKAESLLRSVDEFGDEYGKYVLLGQPLPTRAADDLALMLQYSQALHHACAAVQSAGS